MKPLVALFFLSASAVILTAAQPKEACKAAIKRLADQPNYSWTSTMRFEGMNWTPGPLEGKADQSGLASLRQEFGERTIEVVLKGDKRALKTESGWRTLAELEQAGADDPGRGRMMARMIGRLQAPTDELLSLMDKVQSWKGEGTGPLVGELTQTGAAELMALGRRQGDAQPAGPRNAKGTVKVWIAEGTVSKYELTVSATITGREQEREMTRITTVEIKDLGKTKLEVPEEAKRKVAS